MKRKLKGLGGATCYYRVHKYTHLLGKSKGFFTFKTLREAKAKAKRILLSKSDSSTVEQSCFTSTRKRPRVRSLQRRVFTCHYADGARVCTKVQRKR